MPERSQKTKIRREDKSFFFRFFYEFLYYLITILFLFILYYSYLLYSYLYFLYIIFWLLSYVLRGAYWSPWFNMDVSFFYTRI